MKKSQETIQKIIQLSGLSQRQVAIKSGFQPQRLNEWYKGRVIPGLDVVFILCESTGVSLKDVFK